MYKKKFSTNIFKKKYNVIGDFDFYENKFKNKIGCIQKPLAFIGFENNYSKKKIKIFMRELNQWISQNERRFRLINISLFDQKIFF